MLKKKIDTSKIRDNELTFCKCGVIGWCIEIIWTGLINFSNHDMSMTSTTSILMFPIYGLAFLIKPLSLKLGNVNIGVRGIIYTILFFVVEYISGYILRKLHICPWDYGKTKYSINGLIRLDYAPAWFGASLLYEKLLNRNL